MKERITIDGSMYDFCQAHNIYFPSEFTKKTEDQKNKALIERGVFIANVVACPLCIMKTKLNNLIVLFKQSEENKKVIVHKNNSLEEER